MLSRSFVLTLPALSYLLRIIPGFSAQNVLVAHCFIRLEVLFQSGENQLSFFSSFSFNDIGFFFTATPTTPTVQNVLINPSLIGPKNILITTNMVSSQNTSNESNPLKRKHEDDDDYDNL